MKISVQELKIFKLWNFCSKSVPSEIANLSNFRFFHSWIGHNLIVPNFVQKKPNSYVTFDLTLISPSAFAFKVISSSWNTFWVFSTWLIVTHIFSFTFVFGWIHNKIGLTFALIWTHSICANSICTARFTSLAFIYIIAFKTVTLFGLKYFVCKNGAHVLQSDSEKSFKILPACEITYQNRYFNPNAYYKNLKTCQRKGHG